MTAPRRAKRTRKKHADACTIPPSLPHDVLQALMFRRDDEETEQISSYVEWQAEGEIVTHAEKVTTEAAAGQRYDGWDVHTDKGRWWVITPMTNLYSQALFPSLDYTISFHIGLMARVMSARTTGVSVAERSMLRVAWRRWEQAGQALDQADEAEEFQAVGMRCREALVAMAKSLASLDIVPDGQPPPKKADVVHWCELAANALTPGPRAENARKYLKAVSSSGWQLVSWLTHAQSATRADGEFAVTCTQHIVSIYGVALLRRHHGIPERCPACGSYKIDLRRVPGAPEPLPGCQVCEWVRSAPESPGVPDEAFRTRSDDGSSDD